MKKWRKTIGGMSLAMAFLFSGVNAVHAADVQYGMTGAMALAAVHMQSAMGKKAAVLAEPAPVKEPGAQMITGRDSRKPLDMVASAYGPGNVMSAYGGLTYTGTKVRQGVIAVDPKVIPLGSKVYITGYNTPLLPAGGFVATAEDIGGAIKDSRIDIFLNGTQKQILNFGKQNVKVYVLK